ncbi:hypothetical protein CK203_084299 [Vitis vinifera]|uniref:Uncharacterized protein n=1 Tax=Vitis vinifera TaxID=29760 RepID=A0A438BMR9_VITVI|nr:hypothetical protein CK203_084299 [Vitis vinifera]
MGRRSNEQDLTFSIKEKTGVSQRKVGGGTVRRLVGLPDNAQTTNRKHSFHTRIWNGRSHPQKIGLPMTRTVVQGHRDEDQELGKNLDWADEVRESASIQMAAYQQRAAAHYNRKARPQVFKIGTLVLKRVFKNTAEMGGGGVGSSKRIGKPLHCLKNSGAYHLQKLDGTPLLRPWNVSNLSSIISKKKQWARKE